MNHPNPNPFDNGLHPQVYPSIPQQPQQQAYATSSLGYPQQQPPQPQQQQQQHQQQLPIQQPQLQQQLPPQQNPFLQTITTAVRINDFNETENAVVDQLYLSNHPKAKTLLRIGFMLGSFSMFCTCLWLLTTPGRYFWPLHIIYASCMAWALVFVMGYPSIMSAADNGQGASVGWSQSQKLFAVHGAVSFLTSAMLIVMNFMAGRDYPWAVFPVVTMMGLFAIHANYKAFSPLFSHFSVHFIVYVTINFILLVVYCYDRHSHGAPWFLIVWAAWGFCLLIHLIAYRANKLNKERRMLLEQQQQQQQQQIEEQPVLQSSTIPAYPPQHHAAPAMMRQATLAPHQMMPPQQQQTLPPVRMYPGPPRSLSPNVQQQGSYQQSLYQ